MTCVLPNIALVSCYYASILQIFHPLTPSLSASLTPHQSSTPSRTHTYSQTSHSPPCLSPVSGQKWKDYRGMGVLLSLEIGQILCACPCLSLSQGDPAKSNKQRVCPFCSCNYIKARVILGQKANKILPASWEEMHACGYTVVWPGLKYACHEKVTSYRWTFSATSRQRIIAFLA